MKRTAMAVLLAAVVGVPGIARAWSGPQVSIGQKNGRKVISICDSSGCKQGTPLFLTANAQTHRINDANDWSVFLYQARQAGNFDVASNGVLPVLQVNLLWTGDSDLEELARQLKTLPFQPYLALRFYLEQPGDERMKLENVKGDRIDDTGPAGGSPWAKNETWLARHEADIDRVLRKIDAVYPGKVVGVHIAYDDAGEFFTRPRAYKAQLQAAQPLIRSADGFSGGPIYDWGAVSVCNEGTTCTASDDGKKFQPLFPWTRDSASSGPLGRHFFYLHDYSATTTAGFCAWSVLPSSLATGCRAPTTLERNNATPGLAMPELGKARSVFLDPADVRSQRAAYFNRYVSRRNVDAIIRLLGRAKQVSRNNILTSTFYGYLQGLGPELPSSGHTDLTTLLNSSVVDAVAGPYTYGSSRLLGNPLLSAGPTDAPALKNKLWLDEDDTRTLLSCAPNCGQVEPGSPQESLWSTIRVLRRNVLTAGVHGQGQYFLDLGGNGWYGRADMASETDSIWANLQNAFRGLDKLQLRAANRYEPQVAVFVDDLSPNYVAALTPAGEYTYGFSKDAIGGVVDQLSRIGTPIRQYLLSDLLRSDLDLGAIKLAVLANAYNVPTDIRTQINAKLKTAGRTVMFIYAAGYMDGDAPASTTSMSSLVDMQISAGPNSEGTDLSQTYSGITGTFGPQYMLSPWFHVNECSGAVATLATYTRAPTVTRCNLPGVQGISIARKTVPVTGGSYTSVFAATPLSSPYTQPTLTAEVFRKISEAAGVHHFSTLGDAVEARGNMLVVHSSNDAYKTLTFPRSFPRIFETAIYPSDELKCRNCASVSSLAFNKGDTRAFRWTSVPLGNFELIRSPAVVEGWAADLDSPAASIKVRVYRGGDRDAPGAVLVGDFDAALSRPDVNSYFTIGGNHGFSVSIGSCPSGTDVYMYSVDADGDAGDGLGYIGRQRCP